MWPRSLFTKIVLLIGVTYGDITINSPTSANNTVASYVSPCPEGKDIWPCTCLEKDDLWADISCQGVNKEELYEIFGTDFPDPDLNVIRVERNLELTILPENIFENVTFRAFVFREGVLEDIKAGGFNGSFRTALSLDFTSNRITSFPFSALQNFVALTELFLGNNSITGFPSMKSATLQVLSLAHNPLRSLPSWAFVQLPALVSLDLDHTGLTVLQPRTFVGLKSLAYVFLADNQLTHVAADSLAFVSAGLKVVSLSHNAIKSVAGISGLGAEASVFLDGNNLSEIPEMIWRPWLEKGVKVWVIDNPLACGCEVTWALHNETLRSLMITDEVCVDEAGNFMDIVNEAGSGC
ncbi:oplophorus-luciferin 2-monooxygenase non-catalytic subunit-like [Penaeus indicus]|uniref:oplophorus-luciferin 2-monooxygenase non-catalytic subunit-like n=1 Tax=Penaeus indicus TaxID=29960 RepID=UPI00300CE450